MERRSAIGRFGPAVLLAVLLVATLVGTLLAAGRVHDREQEELDDGAQATAAAISRRMETYAQVLRGAAGLYQASDDVTPRDFRDFVAGQDLAHRYPGVAGVLHAQALAPGAIAGLRARDRPRRGGERPALPAALPRPSARRRRGTRRAGGRRPHRAALAHVGGLRSRPADRPRPRARRPARRGDGPAGRQRAAAPVPPAGLVAGRGARRVRSARPTAVRWSGRRLRGVPHGSAAARRAGPPRARRAPGDLRRRPGARRRDDPHDRPRRDGVRPARRPGAAQRRRPHAHRVRRRRRAPLGDLLHAPGHVAEPRRAGGAVGHRDRRDPHQPARRGAAAHAGSGARAARRAPGRGDDRRAARARAAAPAVQRGARALRLPGLARPAGAAADDHVLRRTARAPLGRPARRAGALVAGLRQRRRASGCRT